MTTAEELRPDWQDIQGQKHPGYGRCIYCGSDGGADGLRDEHIIPFSLGGNSVIEHASCRPCEKITSLLDRHLARSVYGQFRIHAGVQTRNPRERPSELLTNFTVGGEARTVNLPIADHPYALGLPVWGDAGILRGARIDAPFPETLYHVYTWEPPDLRKALGVAESEDFKVWQSGRANPEMFARGIAKIAYCHAVAKFGLDGFRSLVMPDLILGKFTAVSHFVGVPLRDPPPPFDGRVLHAVNFSELTGKVNPVTGERRMTKLHLVSVRLFANSAHEQHGMPIYQVIVGAPKLERHIQNDRDAR